ncbi:matrixin family metalloprotease [Pajaroellobacter abortibovis]|uniref:Peptidase metallopeptidase domain-containing protein n=1 Tax=Pajaroellobacter abortibovis TaxID=1882918 RepID=A0A1L6MXX1_9BACT|nr:matrixin family metalloprotease [Pajaroellobacter abortibovis]APS00326.1 hypothetical protein BCY86_06280 [Pajaroellobacter abortibovis]
MFNLSFSLCRYRKQLPIILIVLWCYPTISKAFCLSRTVPPNPNHQADMQGCSTQGYPLWWRNQCVGYSLNYKASRNIPLNVATLIVKFAFAVWSNVQCNTSKFEIASPSIQFIDLGPVVCDQVQYNHSRPNQNIIVFREDEWPYTDSTNTLGLTTVTFNSYGELLDADIELNDTNERLFAGEPIPPDKYDFATVITHEIGHFAGLAHSDDREATMYPSAPPGKTDMHTLETDDIKAICTLYPPSGLRSVPKEVSPSGLLAAEFCNPAPPHGFGSECKLAVQDSSGGCNCSHAASSRLPQAIFSGIGFIGWRRWRASNRSKSLFPFISKWSH